MTKKTQERQASMLPQGKPQLPAKLRVPLVPRERTAGEFSLMCRCAGDCPGAGDEIYTFQELRARRIIKEGEELTDCYLDLRSDMKGTDHISDSM